MALKTLVKVGNISNLSDARYCAGMGVDLLGFRVIAGSDGSISAKVYQDIRGWITGPQIVAELYGIKEASQIPEIIEAFQPDYFELTPEEYELVGHALTLPFILNISKTPEFTFTGENSPAYLITQSNNPNNSKLIADNDLLFSVSDVSELNDALTHTGIAGVCLEGGEEIRPGLREYNELSEILDALDAD